MKITRFLILCLATVACFCTVCFFVIIESSCYLAVSLLIKVHSVRNRLNQISFHLFSCSSMIRHESASVFFCVTPASGMSAPA